MSNRSASNSKPNDDLEAVRSDKGPHPEVVRSESHDFDIESVRVNPDMLDGVAVNVPLTITVRKPPKQEFIRVHPKPEFRITVAAVELKEEGEFYLLSGSMREQLLDTEAATYTLYTYITRAGALRLWPIREMGPDGRVNEWHRTARIAADMAMKSWIRVIPSKHVGGYEVKRAAVAVPEPTWPDLTMKDIIRIAFKERGWIVDHVDHDLVKKLQGRL